MNESVSKRTIQFSCEGEGRTMIGLIEHLENIMRGRSQPYYMTYGVSKKEEQASDFYGMNGMRRTIGV